ncbi:MAG TPA: acyltransferase family protein [Solirubrobacterales bacterium]|jgi:peptidoglycan/LPS O-acetylase OafA/YrhL|nr:acyltransferase family protein [Solirubrobacterales bacterium]
MPEPVKRNQRYMPGLDGLRAIAVLAVIAFHLGFGWAPGGLLGVGIFFTLSGYLITDLLLAQLARRGGIRLGQFWLARARRLLPALFVMLAIVIAWVTVFGPSQPDQFRKAVLSAVFYVNNWEQILNNVSYFARFAPEEPLNHLWSLSVEEQFYIFWPFLLLIGVKIVHERPLPSGVRPRLALITIAGAIASSILMAILYHPSLDPSRIYYGTDTRAEGLLFGCALAMVWPSRRLSRGIAPRARDTLDGLGVLGLLVMAVMIWRTGQYSSFLYHGGFVVLSLATVLVLMPLTHPACRLGKWLGMRPLRWLGVRSYAIYLWQTPIIVLTAPKASAVSESLLAKAAQVAAIFAIAALSWRFVEEPIRHGALGRFFARRRAVGWKWETFAPPLRVAIVGAGLILLVATAGMAGLNSTSAEGNEIRVEEATAAGTTKPPPLTPKQANSSTKSSCEAVVHIGDSTSEGLDSAEYLPLESQRIPARYAEVGARETHMEVQGARSIEEQFESEPNAQEVAAAWQAEGFEGCWVLALGTNEAANVAAGSTIGERERIDKMMAIIGDEPALWVNVRSLVEPGDPYSEENMERWDEELVRACAAYPNMRIYDWASDVKDSWFIEDGIHFTSPGYAARAQLIAQALAHAFPEKGKTRAGSGHCVVS